MSVAVRILLHISTCVIFIVGKLYFDLLGDFNYNPFSIGNNTYYVWDKLCFLLLTLCVIYPCRELKYFFWVMGWIMAIRLLDEIPEIRDWQWWNRVHGMVVVDVLGVIALLVVVGIRANYKIKIVQKKLKQGIPTNQK